MNTVKTRKVGNSLTVTIPKNLGMAEGQEMVVYKGIDGVIVLAPGDAGTQARTLDEHELKILCNGLSVAEVVLPQTRSPLIGQMVL